MGKLEKWGEMGRFCCRHYSHRHIATMPNIHISIVCPILKERRQCILYGYNTIEMEESGSHMSVLVHSFLSFTLYLFQ